MLVRTGIRPPITINLGVCVCDRGRERDGERDRERERDYFAQSLQSTNSITESDHSVVGVGGCGWGQLRITLNTGIGISTRLPQISGPR